MFQEEYLNVPGERFKDFELLCKFVKSQTKEEIALYCLIDFYYQKEQRDLEQIYQIRDETEAGSIARQRYIGAFKSMFVGAATVWDWISELKDHIDEHAAVYQLLEDDISKQTFCSILRYRLLLDMSILEEIFVEGEYYRPELLPDREDAVLVDCGAFDGQTVKDFIKVYGDYSRIFAFEPAPENYRETSAQLKEYPLVTCLNKGVASQKGEMSFTSHMAGAANRIHPMGDKKVEITTLDEEISQPVTFIKMDIEGAEMEALTGAKRHIIKDKPQLAICVYHLLADLRDIPLLIHAMNPKQRFNLRFHGTGVPEEMVFYADPLLSDKEDNSLSLAECESEQEVDSVKTSLLQVRELMVTMLEAADFALVKAEDKDVESITAMIDLLREALSACYQQTDFLKLRLTDE